MSRFIAALSILGVLALVPACLSGGMSMANPNHGADMAMASVWGGVSQSVSNGNMTMPPSTPVVENGFKEMFSTCISVAVSLLQIPIAAFFALLLLLLASAVLLVGLFRPSLFETLHAYPEYRDTRTYADTPLPGRRQFLAWLSLFEVSPTSA